MVGVGRPDAGRVDHRPRSDLEVGARGEVAGTQRLERAVCGVGPDAPCLDPGERERLHLVGERGPEHGQRQSGVVLHAVVVEQAAAQSAATEGRNDGHGLLDREAPMPPAVVSGAQHVVERQAGVVEDLAEVRHAADREEQWLQRDEMRRVPQEPAPFGERFSHEADLELLQVAQAAVDESR
jgi:hypothetical protein